MNRGVIEEILQRIQASESDLTELTFQDGGRSDRIFIHDLTIGPRHLEFTCSIDNTWVLSSWPSSRTVRPHGPQYILASGQAETPRLVTSLNDCLPYGHNKRFVQTRARASTSPST